MKSGNRFISIVAIIAGIVFVSVNIWLLFIYRKSKSELTKATHVLSMQHIELGEIEDFVRHNIELTNLDESVLVSRIKNILIEKSETVKPENEHIVVLAPIASCGSCIEELCLQLIDLQISPQDVVIVSEIENVYLKNQLLGLGYNNFHVSSEIFESLSDDHKGTVAIAHVSLVNQVRMMSFVPQFKRFLPLFLNRSF